MYDTRKNQRETAVKRCSAAKVQQKQITHKQVNDLRWPVNSVRHAEVVVLSVLSCSRSTTAAGHLCLAVALEARESGVAVRVAIAIALAFATLLASRAAGNAFVDETRSACCARTIVTRTLLSESTTVKTRYYQGVDVACLAF